LATGSGAQRRGTGGRHDGWWIGWPLTAVIAVGQELREFLDQNKGKLKLKDS
jgi:hypothetical protein